MLRGTAVRGCRRRRALDGDSAALLAQGDGGIGGARQERPPLSGTTLRHPVGCRRRAGRQLHGQGDEDVMRLIGDFEGSRTAREEKIRYLERVPIFEACSLRQLRAVADIAKVVEVPERTILTRQGEPGDEFFIIIDGTALVTLSMHKRHRLRPGELFGVMRLLAGAPRWATVTAGSELRVLGDGRGNLCPMLTDGTALF